MRKNDKTMVIVLPHLHYCSFHLINAQDNCRIKHIEKKNCHDEFYNCVDQKDDIARPRKRQTYDILNRVKHAVDTSSGLTVHRSNFSTHCFPSAVCLGHDWNK